MSADLELERNFMHTQFSSWQLQRLAEVNRYQLYATGHASRVATTALDFLHTRASVLRNHLLLSEGKLFIFTQYEKRPGYIVYELLPAPASDQGLLASQVAELGADAGEESAGGAVEAVVDCSLAVVAEVQGLQRDAGAPDPNAGAELPQATVQPQQQPPQPQLLLSRGHGDVVLMRRKSDHVLYSNPVYPLRPQLPCTGVRPLVLEAAFMEDNGDITAVAWAMRSKGPHLAACCEILAFTLRCTQEEHQLGAGAPRPDAAPSAAVAAAAAAASEPPRPASLHLAVVDVQLLLRTKLPPYVARVLPTEPRPQLQPQPSTEAAAASGSGCGGDRGRVVLLGFDPDTSRLEGELEEGGVAPMEATPGGAGGGDGGGHVEDGDDDMDPRTLEQAVARLAHLTSEEREWAQARSQWADIYKESGPDGVGAMGYEPTMDLAAWRLRSSSASGGGGVDGKQGDKSLTPFWRLCCGAHRLLTAEGSVRAYHHRDHRLQSQAQPRPQAQSPSPLLLVGVTDDVDCAVLRVDCWRKPAGAKTRSGQEEEREGEEEGAEQMEAVQVRHAVSIPALAYVAAGKTCKRHLLLSSAGTTGDPNGQMPGNGTASLAAVLVESQRYMYLYGATTTREEYGRQQVVDLGLEEGETVLGARLVEVVETGPGARKEDDGGPSANVNASAAGGPMVVVATQRRLLSYRLRL